MEPTTHFAKVNYWIHTEVYPLPGKTDPHIYPSIDIDALRAKKLGVNDEF